MTIEYIEPVLEGDYAMTALRELAHGTRSASSFRCSEADYPFDRLRTAFLDPELTIAERAVRFRHALRYATECSGRNQSAKTLPLFPEGRKMSQAELETFGLRRRSTGEIEAQAWQPDWLSGSEGTPVDEAAMRGELRHWINREPKSDPWIQKHFGLPTYRGPGQALAVRSALHMEPGATLVIVLPTGEGKSLVFQALAAWYSGKTVAVVVPTVALAIDQDLVAASRTLSAPGATAYIGGIENEEKNRAIIERLRTGKQSLLFAAPEAFLTGLRSTLLEAARAGRLAAIVIDEAHLVDAWGTEFRNDFQLLAALVAELRDQSLNSDATRVVCLSGTLNQSSFDTLLALFPSNGTTSSPAIVAAARLRPECDIWVSGVCESSATRTERVLEALRHLPRPAILYVTRVGEANEWCARLSALGFVNARVVHGDTSTTDRELVIDRWRRGQLDLVVGTSAFGLGIDFPHVRSVVHACVPENVDRYYQEIGRAGRDNRSAIALIISTTTDFPLAKSLSRKRVITEERGLARWEAMFFAAVPLQIEGVHRILVDVGISPAYEPDMKTDRNESWNCNVLNLMARAGIIRYAGITSPDADRKLLLAVDICDERHRETATWQERIGKLRNRLKAADAEGYDAMTTLLRDAECPGVLFEQIYRLEHGGLMFPVTKACGGCRVHRSTPDKWFADWPGPPPGAPMIGRLRSALGSLTWRGGRLYVELPKAEGKTSRIQRLTSEFVDALWRNGMRKFVIVGSVPQGLEAALAARPWCVAASAESTILEANGLPPGPDTAWILDLPTLPRSQMSARSTGRERLYVATEGLEDIANPGSRLSERWIPYRFQDLLERLDT